MKSRSRQDRALLLNLRDAEAKRRLVRSILKKADRQECGFDEIRMMFYCGNRMGLPVLLGDEAIKASLRGYLTAFYDALGKRERKDLYVPRATRGAFWLQGYQNARKRIEEIQDSLRLYRKSGS